MSHHGGSEGRRAVDKYAECARRDMSCSFSNDHKSAQLSNSNKNVADNSNLKVSSDCKSSVKYTCGGCSYEFTAISLLHDHIRHHSRNGSYFYNGLLKTAFPRYDSVCSAAQTDDLSPECLEVPKIVENAKTRDVDADWTVYPLNDEDKSHSQGMEENIEGSVFNNQQVVEAKLTDADKKDTECETKLRKTDFCLHSKQLILPGNTCGSIDVQGHDGEHEDDTDAEPYNVNMFGRMQTRKPKDINNLEDRNAVVAYSESVGANSALDASSAIETSPKEQKGLSKNGKRIRGAKCCFCESVFASPSTLNKHKTSSHKDQLVAPCSICGKIMSSKHTLRIHMRLHCQDKSFVCQICKKAFKSKLLLTDHEIMHTGVKNFICQHCGNAFYTRSSLDKHINKCQGIQPFACSHDGCNKKFLYKHSLVAHALRHSGERPFVCECCGKSYTRLDKLQEHQWTHTVERPWKCSLCPKGFTRSDLLQRHTRTHTKETPFECRFCGKSFSHDWNLKSHERQHTGEKPYKCDICGKGFTHNVSRKTHMTAHHKGS